MLLPLSATQNRPLTNDKEACDRETFKYLNVALSWAGGNVSDRPIRKGLSWKERTLVSKGRLPAWGNSVMVGAIFSSPSTNSSDRSKVSPI